MNLINVLFDLNEFKDTLKTFSGDTESIKQHNEAWEKDLEKREVVINTASKLYDNLLNIYTTQYDKFSEDLKKGVNVLILDFDKDDLPPMSALKSGEEVKLEPEETIAERIKLNP